MYGGCMYGRLSRNFEGDVCFQKPFFYLVNHSFIIQTLRGALRVFGCAQIYMEIDGILSGFTTASPDR